MAENCFRVRTDLELSPESQAADSSVIVKDPVTRRFYRFTAVQASVLRGLDGRRDSEVLASDASQRFDASVTPKQVEDFVSKLRDLLLLDQEYCWSRLSALRSAHKPVLQNLLSIKLLTFSPDALLTGLERRLRILFGPGFAIFAGLSVGAALAISLANWDLLFQSLGTLLSLYSVPLVLAVAFAVMTVHELAHGLSLKHFGGRVEQMGFQILYFIPALYCNVSDAWLLKKRERILVTFAGGYVQFVIWAWATIAWRLVAPETLCSKVCLITIGFAAVQAAFNFNPLLKLDGYYILSDSLEIPNLRSKAFAHLRRRLREVFSGNWRYRSGAAGSTQESIYMVYGTLAFAFTAGILWVMLDRIGGWLIDEFQVWGILFLSVFLLMAIPAAGRDALAEHRGMVAGALARIRKAPHMAILLAALVAGGFLPWELKVSGDFTILPQAEVTVTPQIDGTLRAILVKEGQTVKRGEVLAEIQNLDLTDTYEETKGELAARSASLDLLRAGTRPEEIEKARRNIETKRAEYDTASRVDQERRVLMDSVAKMEAELANAKKNYERSQNLLAGGLIAKNEAERDETAYEVRQKELAEAQGQLKVLDERIDRVRQVKKRELDQARSELAILEAGSRKETIRAMEAEVDKLTEKKKILEQQLELLEIRSPIEGVVATPYLQNRIGEYVEKGNVFCRVVDVRQVRVDLPIPEKEIADVQPNYPIILKVRGYPRRSFEARVKAIAPVAVEGGPVRQIVAQGELENSEGILRPGMTGVGKILCGKRTIAELLSRRAIRWIRTEFWQYLP